ncbi:MAG TPA: alkaline phosphatase D family protein [Xanthobacteraceae bacterium]|nr:alkaline phosphatase D family protein [Xanthobacteraceae bacterium]
MAVKIRTTALTRRRLLVAGAASAGLAMAPGVARPYLSRAADRPRITHGVQSGDVTHDAAMVWARTDRPARMLVEAATTDSFSEILTGTTVDALPESDFAVKALIENLPAGTDVFYRIRFADLAAPTVAGEPMIGHFRTAPDAPRSLSFVWSGDTCGQGWGIDEARGGMRTYAAMLANRPDFFIHSGDTIYADCAIAHTQAMPNGELWRNLVTEEKSRVAETLADFRGNYKYNLLDANVRAFNAQVPMFAQWDDHEVRDDWGPAELARPAMRRDLMLLAARGCRAFHEYMPMRETPAEPGRIYRQIPYGPLLDVFMLDMRSYRGPNGAVSPQPCGPIANLLGPRQLAWLKQALKASRATWKVIAADLPLGVASGDGIGFGDGPPCGRELEIADLLAFIKRAEIRNTLWLTANEHYTAAHHYDPNRAQFQDFEPFWEFVSGPLHAGTWWPSDLDNTFGPRAVFQKASTRALGENLPPSYGLQFFGHVAIDGASQVMTVTLKDMADTALWSIELAPNHGSSS